MFIDGVVYMSTEQRVARSFYVDRDELAVLEPESPMRYDSPQNMNYMAAYAIPVVNYLRDEQPHIVIGCDRGGRLFSLAIKAMWGELMGNHPFPTLDSSINFARISAKEGSKSEAHKERMRRRVHDIVTANRGEYNEQLRVLFVDDFIGKGRVKALATELVADLDVTPSFAVMWRSKAELTSADVYGNEGNLPKMGESGLDRPIDLGFDYTETGELIEIPGPIATHNLERLGRAVTLVAGIVRTTN